MNNVMLSVVIPVFNVETYLEECVVSVCNACIKLSKMHRAESEIILIDDGSFDKSAELCEIAHYMLDNQNISFKAIHQFNQGLSMARNMGLAVALGDIVSFVDSDDYISENMFSVLYSAMLNNSCEIATCNFTTNVDELNKCEDANSLLFTPQDAIESCINDGEIRDVVWNKIYRRELLYDIQFPRNKMSEDVFFTYKILSAATHIVKVSNKLYYYRTRQGSIMQVPFSAKWLDALEAKIERHDYILKTMSGIADDSEMNIINTCVYDGQCAYKFLEVEQRKYVLQYLEKVIAAYNVPKSYKSQLGFKQRLWLGLAKVDLSFCSLLRSRFNMGF